MGRNQNRAAEFLMVASGIGMVCYGLSKWFSDQIGVDLIAGCRLLFSIVLCVALISYAVWNQLTNGFLGLRALLPLALSTLWNGMWPAMQYWVAKPFFFPGLPLEQQHVEWWANAYVHWGGFATLLIGGYAIAYFTWRGC